MVVSNVLDERWRSLVLISNCIGLLLCHLAIDVVIGSPPCVDYSGVNANRKGVEGASGNLHVRLGKMIQAIQKHAEKHGRHCYFVVENVVCHGNNKKTLEEAYGLPPVDVNALHFSPQWRNRSFHTNLPLPDDGDVEDAAGLLSSAMSCLDPGFALPEEIDAGGDFSGAKTHVFYASKGRLNTSLMKVVAYEDADSGTMISRTMNVRERSKIMGYSSMYVTDPLKLLFEELKLPLTGGRLVNYDWSKELAPVLFDFSGGLVHRLDKDRSLQLGPPLSGKSVVTFNEQDYGKYKCYGL